MVVTWFDRWLKRHHHTDVTRWPAVQIQGSDGQWRSADTWPHPTGPSGQLALGADGALGAAAPTGETSYDGAGLEVAGSGHPVPGTAASWQTPPLTGRLELTGVPVLDTWLRLSEPDTNVAVLIEPLGADGRPTLPEARAVGARSMRFLAPFTDERFVQADGIAPPLGVPVHVQIRLHPTDLVVPRGGRLRITVAGSVIVYDGLDAFQAGAGAGVSGPSMPNVTPPTTILHDCTHPTVLRFTMPPAGAHLLDVREKGQSALGLGPRATAPDATGGGLATAPVCGRR